MTGTIRHAEFCTPRPGLTEPRTETFRAERSNADGVVIARPLVHRCMECGERTIDGQPVTG